MKKLSTSGLKLDNILEEMEPYLIGPILSQMETLSIDSPSYIKLPPIFSTSLPKIPKRGKTIQLVEPTISTETFKKISLPPLPSLPSLTPLTSMSSPVVKK